MSYTEQERLTAAQWFLDIHEVEDPSPQMLLEWEHWMEASESHRLAFRAVERAWNAAQLAKPIAASSLQQVDDGYDGSLSVYEWQLRRGEAMPADRQGRLSVRRRVARPVYAWLAAAASVIGLLSWGYSSHWIFDAGHRAQFSTRAREHMQVTLPDGSQVNLGARSSLAIDYTRSARDVRLLAGEGYFIVHKDATRPFRVHVLNDIVTAVGTEFDVRTTNSRVVVAVAEGTVQVTDLGSQATASGGAAMQAQSERHASETARVTRGQSITFSGRGEGLSLDHAVITSIDPTQPSRWRDGWLVYQDEPLRDVLADVSRYTDLDIVVDPAVPLSAHFTGVVFKDSVLEWLESLPKAFPVSISQGGTRIVVAPLESHRLTPTRTSAAITGY